MRKDGICVAQHFPQPPKSILAEAESGRNMNLSIAGDKLPFPIAVEAGEVRVMSLHSAHVSVRFDNRIACTNVPFTPFLPFLPLFSTSFQGTLDVEGVVAQPGLYVFVVHYFSPDNPPILVGKFNKFNAWDERCGITNNSHFVRGFIQKVGQNKKFEKYSGIGKIRGKNNVLVT